MIFALIQDVADALEAMPTGHPRRRLLQLLDEAIRRDVHFLDRHPTTVFQCLWNSGWWYDSPDAAGHYTWNSEETPPWSSAGPKVFRLLERWRRTIDAARPRRWLRALRPPLFPLGAAERVFLGHRGPVFHVAVSDDAAVVASLAHDGTVRVWDAATGRERRRFADPGGRLCGLALTGDGRRLACGFPDGTVRILDAVSGSELREWPQPGVRALAFGRDGSRLAGLYKGGIIRVWDTATGEPVFEVTDEAEYRAMAFADDGAAVACLTDAGPIEVWDGPDFHTRRLCADADGDSRITFGQDSQTLVSWRPGDQSKGTPDTFRVWWIFDGSHRDFPTACRLSATAWPGANLCAAGSRIAAGHWNETVAVIDAATGSERLLTVCEGSVFCVALARDRDVLAVGGADWVVRLRDPRADRPRAELAGHTAAAVCVSFSADGTRLLTGGDREPVIEWDAVTGRVVRSLTAFDLHSSQRVWYSADGRRIVANNQECRTQYFWDAATGEDLNFLPDNAEDAVPTVPGLARSPDFAVDVNAEETALLDKASGLPITWSPAPLLVLEMSPDGSTWAGTQSGLTDYRLYSANWRPHELDSVTQAEFRRSRHVYLYRLEQSAGPPAAAWYYSLDRRQAAGPVSAVRLKELIESGQVPPGAAVSRDGRKWHAATKLRGVRWPDQ